MHTPPGPAKEKTAGALLQHYDVRSDIIIAPSFSESILCPLTQGAASSPTMGDSRPFFGFFGFLAFSGFILGRGPVEESPSRTVCLLGMQPIWRTQSQVRGKLKAERTERTVDEDVRERK